MPNSNTNNILVQRLRNTGLFHANTKTKGLLCYHKSLTQRNLAKLGVYIEKN